jgi:hypothetical protein
LESLSTNAKELSNNVISPLSREKVQERRAGTGTVGYNKTPNGNVLAATTLHYHDPRSFIQDDPKRRQSNNHRVAKPSLIILKVSKSHSSRFRDRPSAHAGSTRIMHMFFTRNQNKTSWHVSIVQDWIPHMFVLSGEFMHGLSPRHQKFCHRKTTVPAGTSLQGRTCLSIYPLLNPG